MRLDGGASRARIGGITAPEVILGPPGTGKTTDALARLRSELADNVSLAAIAFVTFTTAACREVRERLGLDAERMPWLRTIHSTAFRLLGMRPDRLVTDGEWKKFGKQHGYTFTATAPDDELEGLPVPTAQRTPGDVLRHVLFWGRSLRLPHPQALARTTARIDAAQYRRFVARFKAFKREHDLLDFSDLLERCLERGLRPPVDVAFVDEGQDLSPLQIALVEMWFGQCDRWYVFGDEDQAIYGFNGADPSWLLSLAQASTPQILAQSYRVPKTAHALSQRIIRQNKARVPKDYQPTAIEGEVRRLDRGATMAAIDGQRTTFVLARNRQYLWWFATELIKRAIPFIVEGRGGPCPMMARGALAAMKVAVRIWRSDTPELALNGAELTAVLDLIPTRDASVLPAGIKTRVATLRGKMSLRALGLEPLWARMRTAGPAEPLTRMRAENRRYFNALVAKYGELPESVVTLTSIHGAKGREAELVIVESSMTKETHARFQSGGTAAREAENRVFYVAVTRTKHTLILVTPKTHRHFVFPTIRIVSGAP